MEKGHGRIETRRYYLVDDPLYMKYLESYEKWPNLHSIGMVEAQREVDGVVSRDRRYFLCSIGSVQEFAQAARGHWSIENGLHWVLDVAFREDLNRTRTDHSAENLSVLRHIALNLLRAEKTVKVGSVGKPVWGPGRLALLEGTNAKVDILTFDPLTLHADPRGRSAGEGQARPRCPGCPQGSPRRQPVLQQGVRPAGASGALHRHGGRYHSRAD